jgi:hypothetical protein
MWIAIGDLVLKIVGFFTNEKNRLDASRREELDRAADFLERIAVALQEAADAFSSSKKLPSSQIMELDRYLHYQAVDPTVARVFVDAQVQKELEQALDMALLADRLLSFSDERAGADRLLFPLSLDAKETNPAKMMTPVQVEIFIADQLRKVEEASGLYRAAAQRLRVTRVD